MARVNARAWSSTRASVRTKVWVRIMCRVRTSASLCLGLLLM
jgi:hypothetical protein